MNTELEHLVALDQLDRDLEASERTIRGARDAVSAARQVLTEALDHADALQRSLSESREAQHAAERQAKRYRDRKKSAENVLRSGVGDFKAAERQVQECGRILDELETGILEQMEVQDELAGRMNEGERSIALAKSSLKQREEELPGITAVQDGRRDELETQRATHWEAIHPELQDRYTRLCERKKRALSPLQHDACGACMQVAPPQQRIELRRGRLVECRGCHRWLYERST